MDEKPKCKTKIINIYKRKQAEVFDPDLGNFLIDMPVEARKTKAKNELLGPHQDKKLLHSEGNNQH